MSKKFIYKIDHYYNIDHDKSCLIISTEINKNKLSMILSAIQFKFEELVCVSVGMNEEHILIILKEFYGVEDVKEDYTRFLSQTHLNKSKWEPFNNFDIEDQEMGNFRIIQIDMYGTREEHCDPKYREQIKKLIPEDNKKFEEEIKNIRNFYPEYPGLLFKDTIEKYI